MSHQQQQDGWTAVARSLDTLITSRKHAKPSQPIQVQDIALPSSTLVDQVMRYAKDNLSSQTYNHSMRTFYYGQAILLQHFPDWKLSSETYLLTCLLHDIGTTDKNISSTRLSFEFHGGILSLDLLKSLNAGSSQAEAVCETIIRHQDLGDTGMITTLTAITHFATVLDNVGMHGELVHKDTIKSIVAKYPRGKWSGCFASVVRKECELKPWANTTRIEGFAEMIEANKLMESYD